MITLPTDRYRWITLVSAALVFHLPPSALAADVIISEILASNVSGITDEDGDDSDWIELANVSGTAVDLGGWHLTDAAQVMDKWTFPNVTLNPGEELLVWASGKDRALAGGELHTNFKLTSNGEYLGLVRPDGITVEYAFDPYPAKYPDVSFGSGTPGGSNVQLVGPEDPVRYKVPIDAGEDSGSATPWNATSFDDGDWATAGLGVGYATALEDPYDDYIGVGGDLGDSLYQENSTVYLRIPFTVDNPAEVTALTFRARYDDGFAVYINGSAVLASANLPADGVLDFEAIAGASHRDSDAIALEPFPINLADVALVAGTNILAVHGLNRSATSSDFLFDCELEAQVTPAGGMAELVYMPTPTPGSENGSGVPDLGPVIRNATENPPRPELATQTELLVTAEVAPSQNPVESVTLYHRQGYGAEMPLVMRDDGLAPDALAGDGIYSVGLPLAGLSAGEMLRWRIEAADGDGTTSREPFFGDPLNSPEYFGTAVADPDLNSDLPVLEWFIENPGAANSRSGSRASCLYLGEFYDNIFCRVRGNSSSGLNKKSYKFDFNTDYHFRFDEDPEAVRAEEFNLNTTWTDKAYVRQPLSYEIYDRAGSPGSVCFLTRVQQNGAFFSVAAYTEQVDRRLLRREARIDDDGALYKMFNAGTSGSSGVEKKNRTHESNADLSAFVSGMQSSGETLENFIFDNVDLPRELNYLAATVLTQNNDNISKNYYLYRDSEGSGEWTQIPWDLDLTWGSHYMTGDNISHDGIWATEDYVFGGRSMNVPISPSHPFVGIQELPANRNWNRIIDKLLENDRFKDMFRRRLRTLVDELLMTDLVESSIATSELALGNDAVLDRAKWGQFGTQQTLAEAIAILEDGYLAPRRTHLSVTHLASNAGSYVTPAGAPAAVTSAMLPDAQPLRPQIDIAGIDGSPASGDQAEEFVELQNPNAFAVDLSGWQLAGGVRFDFLPGTIIEANGSLFVSPSVSAFRARAQSPRGGEGLNVEGDYSGQISSRGESIALLDASGATIDSLSTPSTPSAAQEFLRITELHYAPPGGSSFEFIELKNIGASPLDLAGVEFSNGVAMSLSGTLGAGQYGIVVSDPAGFPGLNVLGTFTGSLNNGGEQLTLRDAVGENILSFEFDGDWFPPARGGGYSIDILDDGAGWDTWGLRSSWALSSEISGSPGVANPEPHSQSFAAWVAPFFTEAELADPSVSGAAADASGDGVANLLKYALGLDPKSQSQDGQPSAEIIDGSLRLRFRRLSKAVDIDLSMEVSADLSSWTGSGALVSTTDLGDGIEEVVYEVEPVAPPSQKQFLRLKVRQK
ncbi:MAG: lamin tail domain-containing protein [Verrucomicrobiales bacterium]